MKSEANKGKTYEELRNEAANEFHEVEGFKDSHRVMFRTGSDFGRNLTLEQVKPLVEALELLLRNWPQARDGMDFAEPLPIGVKAARLEIENWEKINK